MMIDRKNKNAISWNFLSFLFLKFLFYDDKKIYICLSFTVIHKKNRIIIF